MKKVYTAMMKSLFSMDSIHELSVVRGFVREIFSFMSGMC